MRVIPLRAGPQPGGPDRPGEARGCRPLRLQLGPGSLSGGQRTRRADPLSGGPPQGLEQVEAKERPLVGGGIQMRPSGGIPGSGAGRPQLAEGPGQLPPLQAQEGPGGQQGEVNRPYPGHASARTRIGKVRTKERTDKLLELLQSGKARILSTTISREADRWFVSLTCEVERPDPEPREVQGPEDVVGIDVGLEAFAVLSDGTRIEAPKPLEKALRLLKRRSKQLSRKQKKTVVERDPETGEERKRTVFSRNYEKAVLRFASPHPQHSPGLPAQGHHRAGESQAGSGGGGPERSAERESLAGHSGCGVGGLPADAGV
jgi:hypothetical protein